MRNLTTDSDCNIQVQQNNSDCYYQVYSDSRYCYIKVQDLWFTECLLKDNCLEKDAVVNCDETWCRVKVDGKYRKRYVWCLVNRAAKVTVYYYEDGSRGVSIL